jgi:hypothetical protein
MAVTVMFLAGCATSREVRQPDGWQSHVISCGGPFLNMGHCIEKAGEVCGGYGYTIINREGDAQPAAAKSIPSGGGPDVPAMSGLKDYQERKLYIRCN